MSNEEYLKFKDRLDPISIYWAKFYYNIELFKNQQGILKSYIDNGMDKPSFTEFILKDNSIRIDMTRKHISSTHTWIKGRLYWSKKYNNGYQAPFECSVCGIGASDWNQDSMSKIDVPIGCMHGGMLKRTCAEVLAAHKEYRKHRKGSKCGQCRTYGCEMKGY